MSHSRGPSDCKVYVGDLGSNASQTELEDAFSYYGPLKNVWVARNPPGFAFVEFEDHRDARDSVRGLDGRTVCSRRITAEMSTGRTRNRGGTWRPTGPTGPTGPTVGTGRYGRGWDPADRCYDCGETGHYSYDCRNKRPVRRSRSRSRSRTPPKRSRSKRLPSRSNSRSRSRDRRDRSRSRSPKRVASRSPRTSRSPRRTSRSPRRNGSSRSPTSRSSRRRD